MHMSWTHIFGSVSCISLFTKWHSKLTFYWWKDSISKETLPLFSFVGFPASLWYHSSPVPIRQVRTDISTVMVSWPSENGPPHRIVAFYKKYSLAFILDSPLDGLPGGTANSVYAVSAVILLVVQEPARIRQASHLYPSMTQPLQQLCHSIHVEEDTSTTRAARRNVTLSPLLGYEMYFQEDFEITDMHIPASW